MKIVTCIAPVNIAVIKYWGKRDEELILPLNDSISATLDIDTMCAKTTVVASPKFKENRFLLNGNEQSFNNPRLLNCLKEIKKRAEKESNDYINWNIHIVSKNNFPTAAGLASSAAGYACLVTALANLYGIKGNISEISRRGSGSACRSMYGGWVQWHRGVLNDGSDSIATQIAPASHWPEMRILILVVNENKKAYPSTSAMKKSVETSHFLEYRVEKILPERVNQMKDAILRKDFEKFSELTMRDSNSFHSVCLDTYPPCTYLNDISHNIINLVHGYNKYFGYNKVAYTFDAGPNACLYMLNSTVCEFVTLLNNVFTFETDAEEYFRGDHVNLKSLPEKLMENLNVQIIPNGLKYIIHTKVGEGPKMLNNENEHLLNEIPFLD